MSNRVNITADATDESLIITDPSMGNVSIMVESGGSLGGGTLSLGVRPRGDTGTPEELESAVALGYQQVYEVGHDMQITYTLSGATSPDFDILVSQS